MNIKSPLNDKAFVEEELYDTQKRLFSAITLKEIRFLQSKLTYLKTVEKKMKKKR